MQKLDIKAIRKAAIKCLGPHEGDCCYTCEFDGDQSCSITKTELIVTMADVITELMSLISVGEELIRHNEPQRPNHICGPDQPCDNICADHAAWSALLRKFQEAKSLIKE